MKRNEQFSIMPKILDIAIKNGWREGEAHRNLLALYPANFGRNFLTDNYYRLIILHHGFAKAFFDEKSWKCHLMQMVLMEDPIEYLIPFLNDLTPNG